MHANTSRPTVNTCKKSSYRLLLRFIHLSLVHLFGSISGECPAVVSQHSSGPFSLVALFRSYMIYLWKRLPCTSLTMPQLSWRKSRWEGRMWIFKDIGTYCSQVSDTTSACLYLVPYSFLPNTTEKVCRQTLGLLHINRAYSFPQSVEFRAEPRNLGFLLRNSFFPRYFRGIWRFSVEQLFFHRKWPQSSSVTSLFMMIFCLMVMVEWW